MADVAMKKFLAFVVILAGLMVAFPSHARADDYVDQAEQNYVDAFGGVICAVIDDYPSPSGVVGVTQGVMARAGWPADSAVDIVNASVLQWCPRHWPLLQRTGDLARQGMLA